MVEIAKALSINARVLIMDEPTSALTAKEIDELFRIIRKLRDNGCGIVYISHRLEELQHIVDRVTIMRDGQYITSMNFKETTMDEIITNMVGREIKEQFPRVQCEKGQKIFEVRNLNAGRMVRNINFELYAGEIVGFAGLMGAGRTETTRAIFGVDPKESGELLLDGKTVTACATAFCQAIEQAGYTAGIYFNLQMGYHTYNLSPLRDYTLWIAEPGKYPSFYYHAALWQYDHSGTVPGIDTPADRNLLFEGL